MRPLRPDLTSPPPCLRGGGPGGWGFTLACVLASCGSGDTGSGSGSGSGSDAEAGAQAETGVDTSTDAPGDGGLPPLPSPLRGVTADDVTALNELVASLAALPHKPTARIVFDEGQPPSTYAQAVPAVHAVAFVMGEILDSQYVETVTVSGYVARAQSYLAAFPTDVDLWEVGNEINGEWLIPDGGTNADVVAKMTGAFDAVKAAGGRAALTLYYNQDCWSDPSHEMFAWAAANVPQKMKSGLDYVLVSYYEDDCNGLQPDWPAVFHQLAQMFPQSRVGIGECGTTNVADKAAYVTRYYGMKIAEPSYVGGYFWWWYYEDAVPKSKPLWSTIAGSMK